MHISATQAFKVHATEFADNVVELLWFLVSAISNEPWQHALDLMCNQFIPSFAMEVAFLEATLDSLKAGVLVAVEGMVLRVLQVSYHLGVRVERVKAVIVAALYALAWGELCCHDAEWG